MSKTAMASRIRYVVVSMAFLAAFLLYLHRFCISYAQRYVKEDLGLTDWELSYCFSAFFFAYALAQVPSGWMSDRFGVRRMLAIYILSWSLFTALMGLTAGFLMLFAFRIGSGIAQAGAYPSSAALISKWIPFSGRAGASGLVALGGRLGGGLGAPILTVALIVFFVSFEKSSLLESDDLLDPYFLCSQVSKTDRPDRLPATAQASEQPAARRVSRMLPASGHGLRAQLAATYRLALIEHIQLDDQVASEAAKGDYVSSRRLGLQRPPSAELASLVGELNRVLLNKDLYQADDWQDLQVEREAERCIAKRDALTAEQVERLNRLLVEAVFPNSIKKIYVKGWRPVMYVYGCLGLVVAGMFWICVRNRPSDHPWCNSEELQLIEKGRPASVPSQHGQVQGVPLRHIVRSRSLWLMCVNQWGGNVGWVFLVTWLPRYLYEVHSVPFEQRGLMAAIPLWVGWMGMLLGGWLSDRVVARFGLRWRVLPIVAGRLLGTVAYLCCLLHPSPWLVTVMFAAVAFSSDISNPSSWSYKMDVGGRYVGSIHGWANMWGNFGAAVSPILLQFVITSERGGWDAAFLTCAAAFLIAAVAAVGVDARIPIVPEDDSSRGSS